jgi:hypothetical protein
MGVRILGRIKTILPESSMMDVSQFGSFQTENLRVSGCNIYEGHTKMLKTTATSNAMVVGWKRFWTTTWTP